MLKNKKLLLGFFTCAGLVLIMAHDNNHSHGGYGGYADKNHSHGGYGGYADKNHKHERGRTSYADENHKHDYGYNAYAPKDHTHGSGYNSYADADHKHADLERLMKEAGYNINGWEELANKIAGLDKEYNNIQTIKKFKQRIEELEYQLLHHEH